MNGPVIVYERLFRDARVPVRATKESAGHDLFAYLKGREVSVCSVSGDSERRQCGAVDDASLVLRAGEVALLPLGFKAMLPNGFEAQIRMRSSWAFKRGLTLPNAPGTIDADYPDEWMVMIRAGAPGETAIRHGDRVAQAVMARYEAPLWQEGRVAPVGDRVGGFGSTG